MTDPAAPAQAAIPWQSATVVDIQPGTPRIKRFFFALSQPITFAAGQHVDVRLTAPDGYRAMRSYSIASAPQQTMTIELAIERLDDGEVSPFFHDVVAVGDAIELRGPLGGYFIWPETGTDPVLLVGGGSGVVPFVSMIRHRRAAAETRPVTLLFSARTLADAIYHDELRALAAQDDGFSFVLTLTRERPPDPRDFHRRVDAAMIADLLARFPRPAKTVFVCGANQFVNAAADGAVAAGIPAIDVRTERYGV